jgi:Cu-processing system permease protein
MEAPVPILAHFPIACATFRREVAEHRLNRFLQVHLALSAVVGLLPLFTPDATARAAPAWVLQGVLYCLSLSALLLGLSAAHGDADEFPLLFTQPMNRGAWLAGKVAALALLVGPASLLLVIPAVLTGGLSLTLVFVAAAAAGVCLAIALLGLAIGFWVRDHVRGLLLALGVWFGLLFGTDLLLLALSGAPVVQRYPSVWVLPLMLNPLDALRVTVLFGLEQTAPAEIGAGPLVGWWLAHGGLWLSALLGTWMAAGFALGLAGAARRVDD